MPHQPQKTFYLTIGCFLFFLAMAIFGWVKLKYGFNYIDEGMYMADAWRLTVGDRLFPDNAPSAIRLYIVFNALVFKLYPGITLLGFRQLQYILALIAIIIFGAAIYRWDRRLWLAPLAMAVFSFTGLDTVGFASNLSYYTYPHLFIVLHIAFLIFALTSQQGLTRSILLVASGIALWGAGFSMIPLSAAMISPVLFWLCSKHLGVKERLFLFKDLLLVLFPGIILWGGFIATYNAAFFRALLYTYHFMKEGGKAEAWVNYVALEYIIATAIFWTILIIAQRFSVRIMIAIVIIVSGFMFWILELNLFGLITPFRFGRYSNQMWFCSLIITFIAIFIAHLIRQKRSNAPLGSNDYLLLLILIPSIAIALLFSHYSDFGITTTLYVAIPVTMAMVLFLIRQLETRYSASQNIAAIVIVVFLFPFSYHLAWADWKWTYFDMAPAKLSYTINDGFATGIKTNENYASMAAWLESRASVYSSANDFAIIMEQAPMVYMLIKRRPALNHSWTGLGGSISLRHDSVKEMIMENRHPKIAYRFLRWPMINPVSLRDETYQTASNIINYSPSDPVSIYVTTQMRRIDTFFINGEPWIELYIAR